MKSKHISLPLEVQVDLAALAQKIHGYCWENKIMMVNYTRLSEQTSEHEWEQEFAMRLDIICCILVTDGTLSLTINYEPIAIEKSTLLFISPFDIVEKPKLSEDGRYFVLMFKKDFMDETSTSISFYGTPANFIPQTERVPFLKLTDSETFALQRRFQTLYFYLKEERGDMKKYFIQSAFYTLGLEFLYVINSRNSVQQTSGSDTRKNSIVRSFIILLNEHCTKEHSPAFYAEKLFISVQYLSLILKEKTNQTAGDWISNLLILRAKALLKAPDASIAAVAEALNFSDQSSFGKFFKKHTGLTPKGYISLQ